MHVHLMRDNGRHFPDLPRPEEVTSACIWFCKFRSLRVLADFPRLQELKIGGYPDGSFEALGGLKELRYLSVTHLPLVHELEPLRGLRALETLSLATLPTWEGQRRQTIASLDPIVALPELRHLELLGVCPPDLSLAPLEFCPNLATARFSDYPQREIDRFAVITQLPDDFAPLPGFESRML